MIKKLKKLMNNKYISSFAISFFIFMYLYSENIIIKYHIFSIFLFFLLFFFVYQVDFSKLSQKEKYIGYGLSVIIGILYVLGYFTVFTAFSYSESAVMESLSFKGLILFLGIGLISFTLYSFLLPYIKKIKIIEKKPLDNKKLFIVSLLLMVLAWTVIYFLSFFPGNLSSDSISQLEQIFGNYQHLSDHHPVVHTLLISIPYQIGYFIFHNKTIGVAFISFTQLVFMATSISYLLVELNKLKVKRELIYFTLFMYVVLPLYGLYSITIWKDILFGIFFMLFNIQLYKMMYFHKDLNCYNFISIIILSLFVVFLRNNAIYMYIIFVPFCLYYFRKNIKPWIISFSIVILTFLLVKGPIFSAAGIQSSSSAEYLAIPLQQIGRMAYQGKEFGKNDKIVLNKLLPFDMWKESYYPYVVDNIKFNPSFNVDIFNQNKLDYLKTYLSLVLKNPITAIDGYLVSTVGYWYPNFSYWSVHYGVSDNSYQLKTHNYLPINIQEIIKEFEQRDKPFVNMTWSIGLCVWIIAGSAVICILRKEKNKLLIYVPALGIWLTMMIASPVSGEFRYVFCLFITLPIYMLIPYIKPIKNK